MSDQSVYTTVYTVSVRESYLVIQGQVREGRDVLGPLHQDQQLLLHGLAHVRDGGDLLGPDVAVQQGSGGGDLQEARERWSQSGAYYRWLTAVRCEAHA